MNDIQIFKSEEFGQIRTVDINGEIYFVGKDVAAALGYQAARNAIAAHVDNDDKMTHRISASGQNRDMTIINESGLYSLVLSSGPSRPISDRYGLVVHICRNCHSLIHDSEKGKDMKLRLHQEGQKIYEQRIGNRRAFIREFIRSYL